MKVTKVPFTNLEVHTHTPMSPPKDPRTGRAEPATFWQKMGHGGPLPLKLKKAATQPPRGPGSKDITRVKYQPGLFNSSFRRLTLEHHQRTRSHPERPVKDRSTEQHCNPAWLGAALGKLPRDQAPGPQQFVLSSSRPLKLVSWTGDRDLPPATTGTSQPNVLCATTALGTCIGVALGAENPSDENGTRAAGATVRVMHVFPFNAQVGESITHHVNRYRERGLTVRAALLGGDTLEDSVATVAKIRSTLDQLDVPVDFDKAGDRRDVPAATIGAVVQDDHTVRFITELVSRR